MRFVLKFKNIVVPIKYARLCFDYFCERLILRVVLAIYKCRVAGITK